jgi:transposase
MDHLMPAAKLITSEVVMNTPWPMLGYVHDLTVENRRLKSKLEELQARLNQNSTNSNRPPSSDSPFKLKAEKPKKAKPRKKRKGVRQQCLRPTEVKEILPGPCACGCAELRDPEVYYIHQFIELPEIKLQVTHFGLYRGHCARCGRLNKAVVPREQRAGFGPRLSAMIAEMAGTQADSRRIVQNFCASVLGLPISLGAIQKVIDRASAAIEPHYDAIGDAVRSAPVNHVDETSWRRLGRLAWLWVMGNAWTAFFMIHAHRSRKAFEALIQDWAGVLIADGYGVYRKWVHGRQACLAHLIREAKGLAERKDRDIARCGIWARDELRRLCKMAKSPPTVGEWNMFYARFIRLVSMYSDRKDAAGQLTRHLQREMEHLWLFLREEGVAPTNNHAERLLRFAVIWRKSSFGTASEKGDRWVERILTLRQTCRLQGKRTFPVLVEAMESWFSGKHPDLAWLQSYRG